MEKISGGYFIKARKIQESEIAHAPPHIREIWDWLIKEANFKDKKKCGFSLLRGQCLQSYEDIQNGLHWMVGWRKHSYSKSQCETAMKWLVKRTMVTTRRTGKGLIITICNYNNYQDPKNYEDHKESYRRTTKRTTKRTAPLLVKEERKKERKKKESPRGEPLNLSKEDLSESSILKIKADTEKITEKIYNAGFFKKADVFINTVRKSGKNDRAILHVLMRCYIRGINSGFKTDNDAWAYCQKIIDIENGNYNESDHNKTA